MTYSHVLVGTDGSKTAGQAVEVAARIAAGLGVSVVVITAWQRDQPDGPAPSEEARFPGGSAAAMDAQWAIESTSTAAGIARAAGVTDVRQIQAIGPPVEALLETAATYHEGLLVVGTVGLSDRAERLVGNVPHQLTHHSPIDVLLCTGQHVAADVLPAPTHPNMLPAPTHPGTIALATDGSATAERAVHRGLGLARAIGAEATLVTVSPSDGRGQRLLEKAVGRDDALADLPREVVQNGDAASGLIEVGRRYDVLVVGNKGMSGPGRLLGSVANRLTHEVAGDLLLANTTRSRK